MRFRDLSMTFCLMWQWLCTLWVFFFEDVLFLAESVFHSSIVRIMPVSLTNIEERTYFVVSLPFPNIPSLFNLRITSSIVWLDIHMRYPFRLLLHPRNEETSSRSNGPPLRNGSGATTHRELKQHCRGDRERRRNDSTTGDRPAFSPPYNGAEVKGCMR